MTAPAVGWRRVFCRTGVGGHRPGEWVDVPESDPLLQAWLDALCVTDVDYKGQGPPDTIPQRCCI